LNSQPEDAKVATFTVSCDPIEVIEDLFSDCVARAAQATRHPSLLKTAPGRLILIEAANLLANIIQAIHPSKFITGK
jgi:hypothetical protein